MKLWTTTIRAINPITEELTSWCGPHVPGINEIDAKRYCQENGLGYCEVDGELIMEIPTKKDGITPDWNNSIDYIIIK